MMSPGILEELRVVGTAVVCGAVITIVYDLLRIFRRVIPHGNGWIGFEDFIFWIWTAFWIFSVLYRENDGSFRMYTIASMVLGMIIYHKTISESLVKFMGYIFKKLFQIILFPLKKLKIYIIFSGKKLKKYFQGIIIRIKNHNR